MKRKHYEYNIYADEQGNVNGQYLREWLRKIKGQANSTLKIKQGFKP